MFLVWEKKSGLTFYSNKACRLGTQALWKTIPKLRVVKVYVFWEDQKILQNLQQRFECYYKGQIYGGDFAKFCGLLRIYELEKSSFQRAFFFFAFFKQNK